MAPHASYSVSSKLWEMMKAYYAGKTTTIHNQETTWEDELFMKGTGEANRMYSMMNIDNSDLIYCHQTASKDALFFCLCPNANLYIENQLPPVDLLRKHNAMIVMGTDSLASNDELSILEEIKSIAKKFPHIPSEEMLRWCTFNGAKALQLEQIVGSFTKGKTPGVVLIENAEGRQLNGHSKVRRIL